MSFIKFSCIILSFYTAYYLIVILIDCFRLKTAAATETGESYQYDIATAPQMLTADLIDIKTIEPEGGRKQDFQEDQKETVNQEALQEEDNEISKDLELAQIVQNDLDAEEKLKNAHKH